MKKIIVLFTLLLFINAKGFSRDIFIPIDLERTYLVSECGECGNPVTIDYLLYSPKTQYYYYPNGEMCQLESIKCENCNKAKQEKQEEGKSKSGSKLFLSCIFLVAFLTLIGTALGF